MITVEWILGRPHSGANQDEARAAAAAERVFAAAGVDPAAAWASYAQFDGEGDMTGLAAAWAEAQAVANAALTAGWDKPGNAACSISWWEPRRR